MKTVFQAIFCALLTFIIAIAIISVIEVGKVNNDGNITVPPWASDFPYTRGGVTTSYNGENVWHIEGSATTSASCLIKRITIKAPQRIKITVTGLSSEPGERRYIDWYDLKTYTQIKTDGTHFIDINETKEYLLYITLPQGESYNNDIYLKAETVYTEKFNYFEKVFNYIGSLSNLKNYWEYMRQPIESIANSFLALQNGINWGNAITAIAQAFRAFLLPVELTLRSVWWLGQLVYYTFSIIWV